MLLTGRGGLSVIVPLAANESAFAALAGDLERLPDGTELILVGPQPPTLPERGPRARLDGSRLRIAWLRAGGGRAKQMNAAARAASGRFLWFLHADSRFDRDTLSALIGSVEAAPAALHFFDLSFHGDGPPLMPVTAAGTWFRSRVLGMPFGDQGLCIARDAFFASGAFDEGAPYGEDHLFVWQAARAGVPLRGVGARLYTSARKYAEKGWTRTTLIHLWLTYRQAVPQWLKNKSS